MRVIPGEAGARAVMPGLAADGRQDGFGGDFADACELFQPDGFFEPVLRGVIRVLQGAAAAVVVIGAGGGDARGRGFEDLYGVCFEVAFFVGGDAGNDALAGQGATDKDGFAVMSRNATGVVVKTVDG